ncbi:glycosyltransferase involved in cell wall biosynthesis [Arthrobacter sp. B2I5]|uniref:glycosyltransferase n=1 Tax=Arthrobacter sp. B2I5 TaxID=3042266 RepID=UPI0027858AA6|nr:glycosyltransferase [Arthrobacter sp. B2I5]MDQ0827974.1 glycosyltransferase involved in cell wall biosynthesis [Arthrobacter sp. B2I5]
MSKSEEKATADSLLVRASLILVAPSVNSGGVGDYTQELFAAIVPSFSSFREIRTGGPGDVGVFELLGHRAQLATAIREAVRRGPVVVHFELSAASLAPFWLLAGCTRQVIISATVHDPPWAVWWPFRVNFVAMRKWLHHGIHLPLRPLSKRLERWALRKATLLALTEVGVQALREAFPACPALRARHFIPSRAALKPAFDRPLAVGLYGHAAKGKGFERLVELRRALPPEVGVVVAGRGTEKLSAVPGVTILGAVEDREEDAFFESVRAILLPYDKTSRFYGKMLPASGVVSRAFAYGTPVLGFNSETLGEASTAGGLVAVPNDVHALAHAAYRVIRDQSELERLESEIGELQKEQSVRQAAVPFVSFWRDAINVAQQKR